MGRKQLEEMYEREQKVLELRTRGKSFAQIDRELGGGNSHQVFKRAIARQDNVAFRRAEALRLEEARLDALQDGIWGRAVGGDPRAVEVALKVLERRAKLLGLDFADLISSKFVEIEQSKVQFLTAALVSSLKQAGASREVAEAASRNFLKQLTSAAANGLPAELRSGAPGNPVVHVELSQEDQDLL